MSDYWLDHWLAVLFFAIGAGFLISGLYCLYRWFILKDALREDDVKPQAEKDSHENKP